MKTTTIKSFVTKGIRAVPVTVSVSVTDGIGIHLVGVQDASVKEILLRVCTALQALGYHVPGKKIVIDIKEADGRFVTTDASNLDLPVAIGILAASEQVSVAKKRLEEYAIVGELGLNGSVRAIRGAYGIATAADKVILPQDNGRGLKGKPGVYGANKVYLVSNIEEVLHVFRDPIMFDLDIVPLKDAERKVEISTAVDLAFLRGNEAVRRALEIAAAGGHDIRITGNGGTDFLVKCLYSLLPPMTEKEATETTTIYQARGTNCIAPDGRPLRIPDMGTSVPALIGGGGRAVLPGEVTLAHNGVLFLRELGDWPKSLSLCLRGVRNDRKVTVSRLSEKFEFPADFLLMGTAHTCPCGRGEEKCTCTASQKKVYREVVDKVSEGLFDMYCRVEGVDISPVRVSESGEAVKARVAAARKIQERRFADTDIKTNADMTPVEFNTYGHLSEEGRTALQRFTDYPSHPEFALSVMRVARTIADLDGSETIKAEHIAEAAGYCQYI